MILIAILRCYFYGIFGCCRAESDAEVEVGGEVETFGDAEVADILCNCEIFEANQHKRTKSLSTPPHPQFRRVTKTGAQDVGSSSRSTSSRCSTLKV